MQRRPAPSNSLFDLRLYDYQKTDQGIVFDVSIRESLAGKPSFQQSTLDISDAELDELHEIATAAGITEDESATLERFGAQLFQALMPDVIGACYLTSSQTAAAEGGGLRIRLMFETPELADIPWEFVFDRFRNTHLARSARTALSRYVEIPQPEPLPITAPLQILFVSSHPHDYPPLRLALEQRKIERVLRELESQNLVSFDFLTNATLASLRQRLLDFEYHIVHFMCHGGVDRSTRESFVVLEDEQGMSQNVTASQLQHMFRDVPSTKLVVINACVTSDLALLLGRVGVPAVVAMQYEVFDDSALIFSERFYSLMATGWPVDAAIAEARNEIGINFPKRVDWATPVLYMRSDDGMIFHIELGEESEQHEPARLGQATALRYRRFALSIGASGNDHQYLVGISSPSPPIAGAEPTLVDLEQLHIHNNQLHQTLRHSLSSPGAFRLDSDLQEAFGSEIFNALFPEDHHKEAFYDRYSQLEPDEGLSLQIELADDERLWRVPWELVYEGPELGFLAASAPRIVFSRVAPVRLKRKLSHLETPLKMLVVFCEPAGVDVGCKQEEDLLWDVLRPFKEQDLVTIDIKWNPTPLEFQNLVQANRYHIVQFSGIDAKFAGLGEGIVLVEDLQPRFVEVDELSAIFRGQNAVRLVILNTCMTTEVVSPALVRSGVPSVVSMQYPWAGGVEFPKRFFPSLLSPDSLFAVDLAVAQARTAFYIDEKDFGRNRTDWITPALTTSVIDGDFLLQ